MQWEGQTNSILNSDHIARKRHVERDAPMREGFARDEGGYAPRANGLDTDGSNRAVKFSSSNSNYS